jgi:hypothetical protein
MCVEPGSLVQSEGKSKREQASAPRPPDGTVARYTKGKSQRSGRVEDDADAWLEWCAVGADPCDVWSGVALERPAAFVQQLVVGPAGELQVP